MKCCEYAPGPFSVFSQWPKTKDQFVEQKLMLSSNLMYDQNYINRGAQKVIGENLKLA